MPSSAPGGRSLHRHRIGYRNAPFQLDNPGLIAGAYLEAIPVLNDAAPTAAPDDLPEYELPLEARARAVMYAGQERLTWP